MKDLFNCDHCGISVQRKARKAGPKGKFCSRQCFYDIGKKHLPKKCLKCESDFISDHPKLFCSLQCFSNRNEDKRKRICKFCGQEFMLKVLSVENSCCSRKCSFGARTVNPTTVTCLYCKNTVNRQIASTRPRKYCTRECMFLHKRGDNANNWRGGDRHKYRGADWLSQARLARARDEFICQGCGDVPENEKLSVDHIIPYRLASGLAALGDTSPNDLANLVSLCRSCHGKKHAPELLILKGNTSKFISATRSIIGVDRLQKALSLWNLQENLF